MTGSLTFLTLLWALSADPAHAEPITTAISMVAGAIGTTYAAVSFVGRLLLSVAISAYQKRRMKKKLAGQQSGITTQYTGTGGTTPLSVIVGTYASGGHLEAPQMSQPADSSPPQAYLTYLIGLGDIAGMALTGRVIINDDWHVFSPTATPGLEEYGVTVTGDLADKCWFRFRDGTQTTADPFLLAKFSEIVAVAPDGAGDPGVAAFMPERPWTADMIGRGIPQVIATFLRDSERFPGEPRIRFEVEGIPLYDPRLDTSVGGSGAQRWADPATWAFTENPKVIEYNIHRGIPVQGYGKWGGAVAAEDLPLDNWFAAMNACDVLIPDGDEGGEPSWRFGFEFTLDMAPAEIVDEINRSCGGETVEIGGVYKTRVGGVGLPVFFFTDADILVSRPQEYDPFPGLEETFNALTCSFPDPALLWEAREAPPLINALWEAQDGTLEYDDVTAGFVRQTRRLMSSMSLPGVSNPRQVQRLMSAYANEGRKRRTHVVPLRPAALALEPLDAVAWTSARNGYAAKVFDVVMTTDPVVELRPRVGLMEADAADYTPLPLMAMPAPSMRRQAMTAVNVQEFTVEPYAIQDADGSARRPGLRLLWSGPGLGDARGLAYEVRVAATGYAATSGTTQSVGSGSLIIGGLLSLTEYEARVQAVGKRPAPWTEWVACTTPDIALQAEDMAEGAATMVFGYDWMALSPTVSLTPADPESGLPASATLGTFPAMRGGVSCVGIEATLTAATPRAVRVMIGAGRTGSLDQIQWLLPGVTMRIVATGVVADRSAGIGGIALSPTLEAIGLLTGESVLVEEAKAQITYWRR